MSLVTYIENRVTSLADYENIKTARDSLRSRDKKPIAYIAMGILYITYRCSSSLDADDGDSEQILLASRAKFGSGDTI